MQKQKKEKKVATKSVLTELKVEIQQIHPELRNIKVKPYFTSGKVRARAKIGLRNVVVTGHVNAILEKFHHSFSDKLQTAF